MADARPVATGRRSSTTRWSFGRGRRDRGWSSCCSQRRPRKWSVSNLGDSVTCTERMTRRAMRSASIVTALWVTNPVALLAQEEATRAPAASAFFASETPLEVTITTNLGQIRRDKGDDVPWRAATIAYRDTTGVERSVPLRLRTRGVWRLRNCEFPPLRMNFRRREVRASPFEGLDRPKLVNYCRNRDGFEQYVLQELQLYRVLALLTDVSHRTRLIRVAYVDSARGTTLTTRYAFVIEEPEAMAARVGGVLLDAKGATSDDLDPYHAALVGVFQYMIGNSDWSTSNLHNAELVSDGTIRVVPYDFDFSGAVNAVYATVDPKLPIRRVRDRIYRGHCATPSDFERVFAHFRERRDAIYALYTDSIGALIEPSRVRDTLGYFDEFYERINDPRSAKRAIIEQCRAVQ